MKSLLSFSFALTILAIGLQAAPAPKEIKDDVSKLEGNWEFTSWEHFGQSLPDEARETAKWSVKGNKYKFEIQGVGEEGTIKLDSSKKPATIDLEITDGTDKGKSQLGIYKIEKDVITFCFARPGVKERPTAFTATAENNQILVTLKRQKKED